jgi:hypothetical protein
VPGVRCEGAGDGEREVGETDGRPLRTDQQTGAVASQAITVAWLPPQFIDSRSCYLCLGSTTCQNPIHGELETGPLKAGWWLSLRRIRDVG